jgi:hypothetical protein
MSAKLERMVRCLIEVLSRNLHEGTEERHGKLQDSLCPGRDSNRVLPKQVENVTATPAFSVSLL